MTWLFLNFRGLMIVGALAVALTGAVYARYMKGLLDETRLELRDTQKSVEVYRTAAERAVRDAEELIRSRDAAADDYRSSLDRIAAARGQCLDTRIPIELID